MGARRLVPVSLVIGRTFLPARQKEPYSEGATASVRFVPAAACGRETQSDPWGLFSRPRAACQEGAPADARRCPSLSSRYAFLKRLVTLWAALWAESVLAMFQPAPASSFELKFRPGAGLTL